MFKKVFQSISRTLGGKEEPKPGSWDSAKKGIPGKTRNLLDKISASLAPAPAKSTPPAPIPKTGQPKSPEELCGIPPQMPRDEIKARLALLYRRYNRATSSLDAKLRAEAETMLDAIVAVREKTFGPI